MDWIVLVCVMQNLPWIQVGAVAVVCKSKVRGKDRRRVRGCTSSARDTRLGGRRDRTIQDWGEGGTEQTKTGGRGTERSKTGGASFPQLKRIQDLGKSKQHHQLCPSETQFGFKCNRQTRKTRQGKGLRSRSTTRRSLNTEALSKSSKEAWVSKKEGGWCRKAIGG